MAPPKNLVFAPGASIRIITTSHVLCLKMVNCLLYFPGLFPTVLSGINAITFIQIVCLMPTVHGLTAPTRTPARKRYQPLHRL